MLKYGTDRPDLLNRLVIEDLTAFFADVEFKAFKNKIVRGIVAPNCVGKPRSFFDRLVEYAVGIGMKGLGYILVDDEKSDMRGPIVKFLSAEKQIELRALLSLKAGDALFFISDEPGLVDGYAGRIRTELGERVEGLVDYDTFKFCFIVDFPMYGIDEESGKIAFTHNPFSLPQGGLDALMNSDPLDVLAHQYDIVCNGIELSSGAERNQRPEIMKKAFEIAGYDENELTTKFPALYNAFHYGAPPSAGMAPGVDRIVMLLLDEENIREVIAFPKNSAAQDVLMGAPGPVAEAQLREAHIRVRGETAAAAAVAPASASAATSASSANVANAANAANAANVANTADAVPASAL
jgi:aspartyl-tRNA synthetase